jgi:hypothetical protein
MGIEPTRASPPKLENPRFGAAANLKCDWRVNFRDMWGHVGILEVRSPGVEPFGRRAPIGKTRQRQGRLSGGLIKRTPGGLMRAPPLDLSCSDASQD